MIVLFTYIPEVGVVIIGVVAVVEFEEVVVIFGDVVVRETDIMETEEVVEEIVDVVEVKGLNGSIVELVGAIVELTPLKKNHQVIVALFRFLFCLLLRI